jgi:UDP-2,3-diacylglucosamine hydrolase
MTGIRENALFIADAHYPHHGDDFLLLLEKLDSGVLSCSQLFLMGDNFDLLFGYNAYIQTFSKEAIDLLQRISQKMEVHYFEGNHDFCLKPLFPAIHVYSRSDQPVYFTLGEKQVGMSHGDRFATGAGYDLYCAILRNPMTLTLLKPFQKQIIDHRMDALSKKKICRPFHDFKRRAEAIVSHYEDTDLVIEGHFHQARKIGNYISLPSLACQQQVALVQNGDIVFVSIDELS